VLRHAVAPVEIDQALPGHAGLLGHGFETGDHVLAEAAGAGSGVWRDWMAARGRAPRATTPVAGGGQSRTITLKS